jgi:hypothetical protein
MNKLQNGGDRQYEIMKGFSGEKRVSIGADLYEMVRQLIMDGLRNRHPDLDDGDIQLKAREIIAPWCKKTP